MKTTTTMVSSSFLSSRSPNPNHLDYSHHVLKPRGGSIDSPSGPSSGLMATISRRISGSADPGSALRPFYFCVHPDLFGQFPDQRVSDNGSEPRALRTFSFLLLKQGLITIIFSDEMSDTLSWPWIKSVEFNLIGEEKRKEDCGCWATIHSFVCE